MDSIKLVLADDSIRVRDALESAVRARSDMEIVASACNGAEALEAVKRCQPDVLVTDLVMPVMDGLALIEAVKLLPGCNTRVIVLTALMRDEFILKSMSMGADYYMLKPFDAEMVANRVYELASFHKPTMRTDAPLTSVFTFSLDERIANIFLSIGIPAHIKGYQFLREAIKAVVETPEIINAITKELYPHVANRFSTSASKVERAIRHAIDVAWSRGQAENLSQFFGGRLYLRGDKPTNGEFIALIADRLSIESRAGIAS